MERFQLHGLHHVFSFAKPQDQLVAFLHTFGRKPDPVIQICQFVGPLFPIILFLQLFQNGDPLLQPHVLRLVKLILKNIFSAVVRRDLFKILVIFHRADHVSHPDRQIAEGIKDHPSGRMAFIRHFQKKLCIVKPAVHLIHIADRAEHHNALHPRPVDRVRHPGGVRVFFLRNQRFDFLSPYLIFIFIQGVHLCRKLIRRPV